MSRRRQPFGPAMHSSLHAKKLKEAKRINEMFKRRDVKRAMKEIGK